MRLAAVAASLAVLATTFAPHAGAESPPMDQAWMTPGHTLHLQGSPAASGAAGGAAFPFTVVVDEVTPESVTFHWAFPGGSLLVQAATYDRATRIGPGGGSLLWVNPEDVEAGVALFGARPGVLVLSTPLLHQFYADGQNLFFSADTGLLLRAEDLHTGGALLTTARGMGVRLASTDDAAQTVAFAYADPVPIPTTPPVPGYSETATRLCEGRVHDAFGGAQGCDPQGYWVWADHSAALMGGFPLLGTGLVRATISDVYGDVKTLECRALRPATSALDLQCAATPGRATLGGVLTVRFEAAFTHCLNPLSLFSCPWQAHVQLTGGVWTPPE